MSDRILGAVGLLLAIGWIAGAMAIETGLMVDPIGPRTFPVIVGIVLGVASLVPLLRPDPEPDWPPPRRFAEIALAVLVMVLYTFALEPLGFPLATALAVFVLSWRLGGPLPAAAATGVGVALALFFLFRDLLGLSLPAGPLGI